MAEGDASVEEIGYPDCNEKEKQQNNREGDHEGS
jgi:hypothetical protein